MALDDLRIERYARQILLPGIGAAGQERLLASGVEIRGRFEDVRGCAAWLAGAGVGRLAFPDGVPDGDAMVERNPDCRLSGGRLDGVALRMGVSCLPGEPRGGTALLWGGVASDGIRWARLGRDAGCAACREALPALAAPAPGHRVLLAALLATEALRLLLGLAPADEAAARCLDPARGVPETVPFPFRPGCRTCAAA